MNVLRKFHRFIFGKDETSDFKEVRTASIIIFVLKVFYAITGFALSVFISRYFSVADAGFYFFMISTLMVFSVISRAGTDNAIVKFIALAKSRGETESINFIVKESLVLTLKYSFIISSFLFLFCQFGYSFLFDHQGYLNPLLAVALILPFFSLLAIYVQGFQGLKKLAYYAVFSGLIRPLNLILLLVLAIVIEELTIEQAFMVYWVSSVVAIVIARGYWKVFSSKSICLVNSENTKCDLLSLKTDFYKSCNSLWGIALLSILMAQGAQILLGITASAEQVAYFAVSNRVALLVSFVLLAINGALSPKFAEISSQGDTLRMQSIYRSSTWLMIKVAGPVLVLGLLFADEILLIFGNDYQAASTVLRILLAAQFIKVLVGSVGQLLVMNRAEDKQRNNLFISVFILFSLATLLTPHYGANGAAISIFFAMTINNLLGYYNVVTRLKIRLF